MDADDAFEFFLLETEISQASSTENCFWAFSGLEFSASEVRLLGFRAFGLSGSADLGVVLWSLGPV